MVLTANIGRKHDDVMSLNKNMDTTLEFIISKKSLIIFPIHKCDFFDNQLRPSKKANFWLRSRKANILTADIHIVFRGLKFEPDTEIGQKRVLKRSQRRE
jgi:hypothetical protein